MNIEQIIERFYNREDEIGLVNTMIHESGDQVMSGSQRIINFFGMTGSGKSWLLHWLYHEHREKIPCCLLTAGEVTALSQEELLRKILRDWSEKTDYTPLNGNSTVQELQQDVQKFLHTMNTSEDANVLLLADDYDTFPPHISEVLEQRVLSSVVRDRRALAILASQAELMLDYNPTLRLNTHYPKLKDFTYENVSGKYQEYIAIIPHILRITSGLPVCVEHLIEHIRHKNIDSEPEFLKHEREFVELNYRSPVRDRVLANVAPEMQNVVCALSIPRRFNTWIMGVLLPKIMPDEYQRFTGINYLNLIDEIGELALWSSEKNGYAIRETARRILSYYMALLDAEKFREINHDVLEVYTNQLDTSPFRVHNVVEFLYHTLLEIRLSIAGGASADEAIRQEFSQRIRTVFERYMEQETPLDDLDSLRNMLETDPDIREYLTGDILRFMEHTVKDCNECNHESHENYNGFKNKKD